MEQLGRLWRRLDATAILKAIAGRNPDERLQLSDDHLVELRDLIDEVDEPEPSLLLRVGQAIAIEAYHWVDGEQVFEEGDCRLPLSSSPRLREKVTGGPRSRRVRQV